jgi:WD40 repeat protein
MMHFGLGTDHALRLWDAKSGMLLRRLEGHTSPVWCVAYSPDGSRILSGSGGWQRMAGDVQPYGYELILWTESGMEVRRLPGHTSWVRGVAFAPDGSRAASASWDGTVRIWSLETGEELRKIETGAALNSVAWSPDGRLLISGGGRGGDGQVRLWKADSGAPVRSFNGHTERVWSVAFSPDARTVLSAAEDKTARLWDVASGQESHRLEGHTDVVRKAVFSRDGRFILTASHDDTVRLWTLE